MAHLQAGEWQEAIDAFQALHREYPAHREIGQALEQARFKAGIDAEARVKARRWAIPWRSLIVGGLIIILTVIIGFMVTQIVTRQVLPGLAEARAQREQARLLAEGQDLLEAGALDAAQSRFSELLDLVPGHPEALEGLERIAEQRVVEDLYEQAVAFQESGAFGEAHRVYSEILRRSPGYRDVEERLETVSRRQELDDLFAQAGEAYEAGQAREALSLYETVRQRNVSYESDLVEARLFELYMRVGRRIVDQPRDEDLPEALRHFARALGLRPSSSPAAREHHLAITCAEGLSAYDEGVWGRAIGR
ncbi:MAG: tetratricopeptide repeat protein, partial [Planctomycetota bacterium]